MYHEGSMIKKNSWYLHSLKVFRCTENFVVEFLSVANENPPSIALILQM